jgi:hypothetical protein
VPIGEAQCLLIKISWDSSFISYPAPLVSALTLFPLVTPQFCIVRLVSMSQPFITLMMETVGISETSANFYQTTRRNIPEALYETFQCVIWYYVVISLFM